MTVGLSKVSKIIPLNGSVVVDGVTHTTIVDCTNLMGEHEIQGEFDFVVMSQGDYDSLYLQNQAQIERLTVDLLKTEYKLTTGDELL